MVAEQQLKYRKVRRDVRKEVGIQCPTPRTVGCDDYKCSFSNTDCDTNCLNEPLICVLCSIEKQCQIPLKRYIAQMSLNDRSGKEILAMHDRIQDEILEIQKYWSALKMRQKWTANKKLVDLGGQLKGIRYALYKMNVPFNVQVRLGMKKIEEQMIKFWQRKDGE
jgi:hypothetical protein